MNTPRFVITRADGRSNTQVVLDYVKNAEPGHQFTYRELGVALSEGTDRDYTVPAVQSVVRSSLRALEREWKRTLQNVPRVGYRVALAREHMGLALVRRERADSQLRKGLSVLENVRYDEMDENTRRAHEGHLMVTAALVANQIALNKRMTRIEELLGDLKEHQANDQG